MSAKHKDHDWMPFEEAREVTRSDVKACGIDTERKWQYQKKYLYKRPSDIPYSPQIIYKDSGWVSWADWLGTNNIRGQLKKYTVNHNYFKKWSRNMAYILGFWWADGCMRQRYCRSSVSFLFSLCQQTKDKYILEIILKKMDANNPICIPKSRPNMSWFEINSREIFNDIVKLGGSPRKSKTLCMPKIPKKYLPDFIRGLFDGDGSITICRGYGNCYSPQSYICSGSIKFLHGLKKALSKENIVGKIKTNCAKKHPCFLLRFGANDTRRLGQFMYKNVNNKLKLIRKFEKFINNGEYIWNPKAL